MKAGTYIHIPFCLTKCGYCNFFSVPYSLTSFNNYINLLLKEIESFKQAFDFEADTVYLGGGTPSLLSANQINSIIGLVQPDENAEITLEVNPVQITEDWVKVLSKTRVNRLSLGVQSMNNENLKALGRKHTAESIPEKMKLLRYHGFNNISLDMLYGLPIFANYHIEEELDNYLSLEPEHISTYLLSIDNNVPFKHWQSILPDDKSAEIQYNTICKTLREAGWNHYEISNFAQPDFESRHNLHYWLGDEYIGMGAGASGFVNKQRYHRPDDLELWQFAVEKRDNLYEKESETKAQQKADLIIMQLRLSRGLDIQEYKERFGSDFLADYHDAVEKFITSGHMEIDDGYIKLTPKARFVSNHILREFV